MTNFLIVIDNNDDQLGDYFVQSYFDLIDTINQDDTFVDKTIECPNCTSQDLQNKVNEFHNNPFIFVSFSHGLEDEIIVDGNSLVNLTNTALFNGCLFYTAACLTGQELGPNLIAAGCRAYIGYLDEVFIQPGYEAKFIECENYALKNFCSENRTIKESYDLMVSKYNQVIEELLTTSNMNDFIAATIFVSNKDLLTFLGDPNLTINNLRVI